MAALQQVHVLNFSELPAGVINPASVATGNTSPVFVLASGQVQTVYTPGASTISRFPGAGAVVSLKYNFGPTMQVITLVTVESAATIQGNS